MNGSMGVFYFLLCKMSSEIMEIGVPHKRFPQWRKFVCASFVASRRESKSGKPMSAKDLVLVDHVGTRHNLLNAS